MAKLKVETNFKEWISDFWNRNKKNWKFWALSGWGLYTLVTSLILFL